MTLAATPQINSYVGTGALNSYPFNFQVFLSSHIVITINAPSPSTAVYTLTLGTDFTVSGLNTSGAPSSTGTITLVSSGQVWLTGGNLTTGYVINISRVVPLAQTASVRNQGDFYQSYIENELDYLTMALQQIQYNISLISGVVPAGSFPNIINVFNVSTTPTTLINGNTHLVHTAVGAIQLNLPQPQINVWFFIKDADGKAFTSNITVHRFGSELIDGVAADFVIPANYAGWLFVSDGTNWFSLASALDVLLSDQVTGSLKRLAISNGAVGTYA